MSILTNLTEGIVNRDLSKEGEAILNKWEKTGLLEGLDGRFQQKSNGGSIREPGEGITS